MINRIIEAGYPIVGGASNRYYYVIDIRKNNCIFKIRYLNVFQKIEIDFFDPAIDEKVISIETNADTVVSYLDLLMNVERRNLN